MSAFLWVENILLNGDLLLNFCNSFNFFPMYVCVRRAPIGMACVFLLYGDEGEKENMENGESRK